ncbi:cupin domain-containing protein [Clostridium sp.]|uniref:cupin domain-containing protein n=1 Tax=Clostridium sp. TaxID=1506 RepID=UPI002FC801C0
MDSKYYIKNLNMEKHPEGGYFKESFISNDSFIKDGNNKILWTSIYFLLHTGEVSNFHRLKSDEMWYFHDGEALTIYMITPEGLLIEKKLGLNILNGEEPQILVPKGYIFGSAMNNNGFSLVGCMVSPGFDFNEFELFERAELLSLYPEYIEIITRLTIK